MVDGPPMSFLVARDPSYSVVIGDCPCPLSGCLANLLVAYTSDSCQHLSAPAVFGFITINVSPPAVFPGIEVTRPAVCVLTCFPWRTSTFNVGHLLGVSGALTPVPLHRYSVKWLMRNEKYRRPRQTGLLGPDPPWR